ncbi:MAG: DUF2974 domain-containing protein [Crocinitomix sp.]|nr:DUF2974 domain-containing protein [Crocinitomix sp.]
MDLNLNCRLICASQASYAIGWDQITGAAVPENISDINFRQQYEALEVQGSPYIVVADKKNAALVVRTPHEIILAYRGTVFDSVTDWINNILVKQETNDDLTGKVHDGFLKAMLELAPGVNTALMALTAEAPDVKIYITGHSKGGGIAPIAAMYLTPAYKFTVENVVTFAGPSPGDGDFANAFNAQFPNAESYQNSLDIVPLLPPGRLEAGEIAFISDFPKPLRAAIAGVALLFDYQGVGTVKCIDLDGNVVTNPADIPGLFDRLSAIATSLKVSYKEVLAAHTAGCGFRYMHAVCEGTVCIINPADELQ